MVARENAYEIPQGQPSADSSGVPHRKHDVSVVCVTRRYVAATMLLQQLRMPLRPRHVVSSVEIKLNLQRCGRVTPCKPRCRPRTDPKSCLARFVPRAPLHQPCQRPLTPRWVGLCLVGSLTYDLRTRMKLTTFGIAISLSRSTSVKQRPAGRGPTHEFHHEPHEMVGCTSRPSIDKIDLCFRVHAWCLQHLDEAPHHAGSATLLPFAVSRCFAVHRCTCLTRTHCLILYSREL